VPSGRQLHCTFGIFVREIALPHPVIGNIVELPFTAVEADDLLVTLAQGTAGGKLEMCWDAPMQTLHWRLRAPDSTE
jgi:hypothetical protein